MIPFKALFDAATKHHMVRQGAVMIVLLSLVLYGFNLAYDSNVHLVTQKCADCEVQLADRSARLELTLQAVEKCSRALDLTSPSP